MPRTYSMDKRAADAEASRRHILAGVVDVAARDGLEALTMQAVAEQADLAVRTVYNHFSTREEMIAAALGDLAEATRASVRAIDVSGLPPRDQCRAFVDAYLRSYDEQGRGVQVLLAALSFPAVSEAISEVRRWRRATLRSILRRCEAGGLLRIPLGEAVDVAYLATAHATYASLTTDARTRPLEARDLLVEIVDRTCFVDS
jgi:AcrR family transcriptional regulator